MHQIDHAEIVASLRESLLVLTDELVVEYASDRFYQTFGVRRQETLGRPLPDLGNGQWNIPDLLDQLERILRGGVAVEDFEVDHVFEHVGRRVMRLNARKTIRPGNGSRRILVAIEDVTRESDAGAELERQRILSNGIVDTLREPLLVLDDRLSVVTASRCFYATFQVDREATIGRRLDDLGNGQWDIPELLDLLTDIVPRNASVDDFEVRHTFPNIGEKIILLNARKVFREGNHTGMLLLAMQDVTERRRLEAEREAALEQAGRLLEELNHRVMNSLSMIGAIIAMEARSLTDAECQAAFNRMRARIEAVATLYRNLSHAHSVDTVQADVYLSTLVRDLVASSSGAVNVALEFDIAAEPLSTRIAVPLGLILNEIVTNSLKYAFRERSEGRMGVSLASQNDTMTVLIWDDGPGIDPAASVVSGLGQKLTEAFSGQLGGAIHRNSGPDGTRYTLTIPL
ncbi:sensor histidine kinase [Allgaiera indica]|uniref:sensor histidine kinase n=1 Tax=Allgaiera indica TaxID=765699 RepID=UPI0005661DFA|nr:histidine kinase dimerization/phosphoacceptor domain -containing protein [Allgaiera indica]